VLAAAKADKIIHQITAHFIAITILSKGRVAEVWKKRETECRFVRYRTNRLNREKDPLGKQLGERPSGDRDQALAGAAYVPSIDHIFRGRKPYPDSRPTPSR
jgi:hypothetical protein